MTGGWILAVWLFAGIGFAQDDQTRLKELMEKLGSESAAERDAATEEMVQVGRRLLRFLAETRDAAKDPELKARLDAVIKRIRQDDAVSPERLKQLMVDIDIVGAKLSTTAREVEKLTSLSIRLDIGADQDADLGDLKLKQVSVETVLNIITQAAGLRWGIENNSVIVVLPSERFVAKFGVIRIFDVRELNRTVGDSVKIQMGVIEAATETVLMEPTNIVAMEDLIELIKQSTGQELWQQEGVTIHYGGGFLIVRHGPEVCDQVAKTLAGLRKDLAAQVQMRFEFVAMKEGVPVSVEGVTKALEAKEAVVVGSLEATCLNNQRISGHSGTELYFVSGYDGQGSVQRQLVRDGVGVSARPTLSADRKTLALDFEAVVCKVQSVERVKGTHGEVQVPALATTTVTCSHAIAVDAPAVIAAQGNFQAAGKEYARLVVIARASVK